MKPLEIGDYVLATKYGDGDPGDHWVVGFFDGMLPKLGGDRFMVVDANGRNFRGNGFRRIKRISAERGAWLLAHARDIEYGRFSVWFWARRSMKPPNQPEDGPLVNLGE